MHARRASRVLDDLLEHHAGAGRADPAYLLLVLILIFRPKGLLGTRET